MEDEQSADAAWELPHGVRVEVRHLPDLEVAAGAYFVSGVLVAVVDTSAGEA